MKTTQKTTENLLDVLRAKIPQHLLDVSGVAPYSGREAFTNPSAPVYFLGLNPGGDPDDGIHTDTVRDSLKEMWGEDAPDDYSGYFDAIWGKGRGRGMNAPGASEKQQRIQHVFQGLGLNLRTIPSSNLVFHRSATWDSFPYDRDEAYRDCVSFHVEVINALDIRTIITTHDYTFRKVCELVDADKHVATDYERNARRWQSVAMEGNQGCRVLRVPHFSRSKWNTPATDPTGFIRTFGHLEYAA